MLKNRDKLVIVLISLAMSFAALAKQPPNIIVIMVDDMGYGGLSSYDNPYFETPEIDRLAAEGLKLTDYHSNGTVCTPTRASLMTGLYPHRTGGHVVFNASPKHVDHRRGMPDKAWTFPEALKEQGYTSAIFGKWHLGYKAEFNPLLHGFDQFNGFLSGNIDAHSHYDQAGAFDWWQGQNNKDEVGYHTDLITNNALKFIEKNKDKPFFAYIAHGTPHTPIQARGSKIIRGKHKGKIPAWGKNEPVYNKVPGHEDWLIKHFILPVDEGVGLIRQKVEELGLADNTIIWFISDNGAARMNDTKSDKTRGIKTDVYEGGHRVPGIVWAPNRIKAGVSDEFILSMDIMPTMLAQANVLVPKEHHFDGKDVSEVLFNSAKLKERTAFWSTHWSSTKIDMAYRKGPWKLVNKELYNLAKDPQEKIDLASRHPQIVVQLSQELQALYTDTLSESPYDNQ